MRVVREALSRAFVMENVLGLAYSHGRPALDAALDVLRHAGYKTEWAVVNAADLGVPQRRQRVVVVGALEGAPALPSASRKVSNGALGSHATVKDAFAGLRTKPEVVEEVNGKYGHLLPGIPPGRNYLHYTHKMGHPRPLFEWRSKCWSFLLKLDPAAPAWTIQASPGPYIGPFHWENRRLRIPEVKRLQTFPDSWRLAGGRNEQWRQLGNAVPCLMAQRIGEAIRGHLEGEIQTPVLIRTRGRK